MRFIHFALFEGTLLSLHYYLVDAVVVFVIGSLGFRYYRARQMTTQYRWLYERTGPFTWREQRDEGSGRCGCGMVQETVQQLRSEFGVTSPKKAA